MSKHFLGLHINGITQTVLFFVEFISLSIIDHFEIPPSYEFQELIPFYY